MARGRPHDMPPAERYQHGARARYVTGCRCAPCRAANAAYYHVRQRRGRELAATLGPAPAKPTEQLWTAPDGSKRVRRYRRACPGVFGQPCPKRSHLRRDSMNVCAACRDRLAWNGLVHAGRARKHIKELSRKGVGYKSVAAAADVATSIVAGILSGEKPRVRARTSQAILAVTGEAVADHALVPAARTWELVERLKRQGGFTQGEIARRLGYSRPALQLGRKRVLAKTQLRLEKFARYYLEDPRD